MTGLRAQFVSVLVTLVLLVTAVSTLLSVSAGTRDIRDSTEAAHEEAAIRAAQEVGAILTGARRTLTSTASVLSEAELRPLDERAVGVKLDALLAFGRDFAAVMVADADARTLLARPDAPAWREPAAIDPDQVRAAILSGAPAFSARGDDPAHAMEWVVPIPASGSSLVLVGVLRNDAIEEALFSSLPPHATARLVDASGVARAVTSGEAPGTLLAASAESGAQPPEDPGRIVGRSPPILAGLSVVVEGSQTRVKALQARLVGSALLTSLTLGGVAVVAGVLVSRRITRPLANVRDATRRMSMGSLDVRAAERGPEEVRSLARDFNEMAANLQRERDELRALERHLEDLVAARTRELDEKREENELLFYGVSHDIKNPVAALVAFSELAEESLARGSPDPAQLREFNRHVRDSATHLESLVREILLYAQAQRVPPTLTEVDVAAAVEAVIVEAGPLAIAHRVTLRRAGEPLTISTDAARFHRILGNLVGNGIKYMPPRAEAEVKVAWRVTEPRTLELVVSDNGAGIPLEVLPLLFRPFSRHLPAGRVVQGTGLGLSVVRGFVTSLGGTIGVVSAPGEGASFVVKLPLDGAAAAPPSGGAEE